MDTSCSFHMTPMKNVFINIKETSVGKVRMASNLFSEVKGIGSVRFQNPDDTTVVLYDVRYIPDISRNLISLDIL